MIPIATIPVNLLRTVAAHAGAPEDYKESYWAYATRFVFLMNGYLYATDGYSLVRVTLPEDCLHKVPDGNACIYDDLIKELPGDFDDALVIAVDEHSLRSSVSKPYDVALADTRGNELARMTIQDDPPVPDFEAIIEKAAGCSYKMVELNVAPLLEFARSLTAEEDVYIKLSPEETSIDAVHVDHREEFPIVKSISWAVRGNLVQTTLEVASTLGAATLRFHFPRGALEAILVEDVTQPEALCWVLAPMQY